MPEVRVVYAGFNPSELGKGERAYAAKLRLEAQKALRAAGRDGLTLLRTRSAKIRDRGAFQKGWKYHAAFTRLEFWNPVFHSLFVEGGRRAKARMPPVHIIEDWALRNIGIPGLGYAIAKNIARRGIAPRRVLSAAEVQAELAELVAKGLRRAEAEAGLAWRNAK